MDDTARHVTILPRFSHRLHNQTGDFADFFCAHEGGTLDEEITPPNMSTEVTDKAKDKRHNLHFHFRSHATLP